MVRRYSLDGREAGQTPVGAGTPKLNWSHRTDGQSAILNPVTTPWAPDMAPQRTAETVPDPHDQAQVVHSPGAGTASAAQTASTMRRSRSGATAPAMRSASATNAA